MKKQTLFFMTLCIIISASLALSQTSLGEIGGFVLDKDGKAVIGATIKATSDSLMGVRNVVSGAKGYYRIINLPPGKYALTISMESYQAQEVSGISVRAGKTSTFNITLEVGDFEEIIQITHEAPLIDTSSPERSINIDGNFISRLPLAYDREWDNVWALSPGTINEGQYGPYGNRVTVEGADIFQNVWNLDGMQIGDTFTNANGVYFSPDIIDDVQLVTTGFNASVSSGQGGYVNVVTKSGGNDFHGTVSFTFQPESWNWSNIEGGEAAKTDLYLPEFSLGGPILKDKAWFFANYRRNMRNEAYARTPADLAVFDKLELPYSTQKRETTANDFFGKITYAINDNVKMVGTYNYDAGVEANIDMGALYADNSGVDAERGGQYASMSLEGVLSDNFDWSLKGSYYKASNLTFGPGGFDTASYSRYESYYYRGGLITGTGDRIYHTNRRGTAWGSDAERERWEVRGDARYYLEDLYGNHSISFGFSGIPKQVAYSDGVYATPASIYETKNAAGQWVPFYEYTYTPARKTSWDYQIKNYAGYVQDSWVVNDRVTVNAGVRIENQTDDILLDITEFSPNIGINYALTKDLSNTVRFSYSLRHHLLAGRDGLSQQNSETLATTKKYDNDLDGTWDVIIESPFASATTVDPDNMTDYYGNPIRYSDDFSMPYAHEFQLGYVRVLPYGVKFDFAWVYKMNKGTYYEYDHNVIYQNGEFVGLVDESIDSNYEVINNDKQTNHFQSYEFMLTKQFSQGWQLMASYSYQRSTLKGEWQDDNPYKYMHPESWFESKNDGLRPHILRAATSVILPYEFTFNANLVLQSGPIVGAKYMPYGTGIDVPATFTLSNGRVIDHPFQNVTPYYQERSKDRTSFLDNKFVVNLGIGKDFNIMDYQFQVQFQVFNVFNNDSYASASYTNYVNADGSPYRSPYYSWVQPPRAAQAYIKWIF